MLFQGIQHFHAIKDIFLWIYIKLYQRRSKQHLVLGLLFNHGPSQSGIHSRVRDLLATFKLIFFLFLKYEQV